MGRSTASVSLVALAACQACSEPALPFGADAAALSAADRRQVSAIFADWFAATPDGRFIDAHCGDVQPRVRVVDLDRDGAPEVAVTYGNACLSGSAGSNLSLFIRDESGVFHDQFGFPAAGFEIQDGGDERYPDLLITGPGFCFPRWSWHVDAYEFVCSEPQAVEGCAQRGPVCPD